MSPEWKAKILSLQDKDTEDAANEFVALVDQAVNRCDLETARALMKTFTTDEDYGVQESVVSALSTAKPEDYQTALLEDLPRLLRDAPEWAQTLIEREVKSHPEIFLRISKTMPTEIKK